MKKNGVIILVLSIALLVAIGYIGLSVYQNVKAQKEQNLYIQGAQEGFKTAIGQIIQTAATCQQVPLTFENTTVNMIAVECIQQQQSAEGQ